MADHAKKVLVIEDEKAIRSMYDTSLKNNGYAAITAPDGEAGLAAAAAEQPDVILLDVMMPKLDGWAVLESLKGDPKTKDIPVVMLTNLGQDEDRTRGQQLGAVDYWVKADLTPMQINEKLKQILT